MVEIQLALDRLSSLVLKLSRKNTLDDVNGLGIMAEASSTPGKFPVDIANIVVERDRRGNRRLVIYFLALSCENAFGDGHVFGRV
jgi:hypothetical protein